MNQYIIDDNNNIYIGLFNVENKFCYYISALQRLHSSKTLNERLISQPPNNYLLKPLASYAKLKSTDEQTLKSIHDEIYNNLNSSIKNLSENLQNGGNPDHVLMCLMLPCISLEYGLEILKPIVKELYINPDRLNHLLYSFGRESDFNLTNSQELNSELKQEYIKMANAFKNTGIANDNSFKFNISTMAIMFKDENNDVSKYAGHAINLILGRNEQNERDIYVIDDSVNISTFKQFIERHRNRIGYFEIKDATDEILKLMSNTRGISIDKRLHRDVINVSNDSSMSGGDSGKVENVKINECTWYPIVEVKREKILGGSSETHEIIGEIGGTVASELPIAQDNEISQIGGSSIENEKVQSAQIGGSEIPKISTSTQIFKQSYINSFKSKFTELFVRKILIVICSLLSIILIILIIKRYSEYKKLKNLTEKNEKLQAKNNMLNEKIKEVVIPTSTVAPISIPTPAPKMQQLSNFTASPFKQLRTSKIDFKNFINYEFY